MWRGAWAVRWRANPNPNPNPNPNQEAAELAFELSSRALAGSPLLGVREGLADKLHLKEGGGGGGDDDGSGSDDDNVGGVLSRRLP